MHFISHESRERHKIFDTAVAETAEITNDSAVTEALSERYVVAQQFIVDNFFAPNIRHSEIKMPRRGKDYETGIPLIIAETGESFMARGSRKIIHVVQESSLTEKLEKWGAASDDIYKFLGTAAMELEQKRLVINFREKTSGSVTFNRKRADVPPSKHLPKGREGFVWGLPYVALGKHVYAESQVQSALVLTHEIAHVTQAFVEPFEKLDEEQQKRGPYRRELEAYYLQACVNTALFHHSTNAKYRSNPALGSSVAYVINHMRKEETAHLKDKFYPTGRLMKRIDEAGLDIGGPAELLPRQEE